MTKVADIREVTDSELVEMAGTTVVGTPSGLNAQLAQAELTRRNTEALRDSKRASDRSSDRMLGLTLVIGLIAFLQLVFMFIDSLGGLTLKIAYGIGAITLVFLAIRDFLHDLKFKDV